MKKVVLLTLGLTLIFSGALNAQNKWDFDSFTLKKGIVKSYKQHYKLCTFTIKEKGDKQVVVDAVHINGEKAGIVKVKLGNKDKYVVKIPTGMNLQRGTTFDVEISFGITGGFLMGSADAGGPGGPGGPGGGGDPTTLVIKYP